MTPIVILAGTMDTKSDELGYLAGLLRAGGVDVRLVDIGTQPQPTSMAPTVTASTVAEHHPQGAPAVLGLNERGKAVAAMGEAFAAYLPTQTDIAGVIGIGGGGGTSMICQGLRAMPLGLPKIMVSTLASGDVAPYVGVSDIVMMPSVTDLAGLNRVSRVVLHNAAQALLGMVRTPSPVSPTDKPSMGLTMFGVTTPCVTSIVGALRDRYDCMVFHATGTGGQMMEKLADSGLITGFLDMTTTEIADLLVGGVLAATQDRLGAVARTRLPYVGSVGALDMVNFWAPATVPEKFRTRLFHHHNPNVTLMRTTVAENTMIGTWIGERLNLCDGPVRFLLPKGGISALDTPGGPFWDPQADAALFDAIESTVEQTADRKIIKLVHHINDPAFAAAAVAAFGSIAKG
jgi:uncharacterized protein (UPF0261 family)